MNPQMNKKIYILDTNVLMEFSRWIPISLNKSFWDKLEESLGEGKWVLLDVVVEEIKYNEKLKEWCEKQKRKGFIKTIGESTRERAVEINNIYKMIDETDGNSTVDTYIIAYAEENKLSVFSMESFRIKENGLLKIPEVCQKLKIGTIRKPILFLESISFNN